ncbi:hypothetical protein CPT_Sonora_084 [Stenotrophomonas phage Sonora]|nr:hypothetical protein CPT_Sonora_084 [Stenotrophomonas phage Sonora]
MKTHRDLCDIAVRWLRRPLGEHGHGCTVAVSEVRSGSYSGETPDAVGFRFAGYSEDPFEGSVVVEVKMSRADFKADASKPHRKAGGIGNWRYYMTPTGLLRPEELPVGWGLIEVNDRGHCKARLGAVAWTGSQYGDGRAHFPAWRVPADRDVECSLLTRLFNRVGDAEKLNRMLADTNALNGRLIKRVEKLEEQARKLRAERWAQTAAAEVLP